MQTNKEGLEIILKGRKKDYTELILRAERKVDALIYSRLNTNQFSALVSLCIDIPRVNAGSRIIKAVNAELYITAAGMFEEWEGSRRVAEKRLFLRPCLVVHNVGELCHAKKN